MDFTQAIKTCLVEKYACFTGRARRSEYWFFFLGSMLISLIIFGITLALPSIGSILNSVFSLGIIVPSLAVSTRRLHDTGRSGWHLVISYILAVIAIILLFSGVGLNNILDPEHVDYQLVNMPLLIVGFVLYLITCIYGIVIFVFSVMDSTPGTNQYGPNPKGDTLDSSDF